MKENISFTLYYRSIQYTKLFTKLCVQIVLFYKHEYICLYLSVITEIARLLHVPWQTVVVLLIINSVEDQCVWFWCNMM